MPDESPLGLPPPLAIWEELAGEAQAYINLLNAWKAADAAGREELEGKMLGSLSHIRVHSAVMNETLGKAMLEEGG